MGLFLLARRTGSTDFDAGRALPRRACFWLGVLVIRAMDTLPFDAECAVAQASPGNPQLQGSDHYIGKAVGSDCGVKGRAAYRKFRGESVKQAPAQGGGDNRGQSIQRGWRNRPPAPPYTRHALPKIPRASARGRGYESVGKCFAAARYGTLPFPHLHCPPSGDREARPLSRRRPLSSTGAGDFEVRARRALTALRLPPARVTQSSTSFEIED